MKACVNCEGDNGDCYDPNKNPALKREIKRCQEGPGSGKLHRRVIQFARQGYKDLEFKTYDTDWDSEAYLTVPARTPTTRSRSRTTSCALSKTTATGT
jgi:ribonucleoside-diphosphate reductase alpha chain